MIEVETIAGAAYWASYLINGDASGLTDEEQAAADNWLEKIAPWYPVSAEGEAYFSNSYGLHTYTSTQGGDLLDYVCHNAGEG